MLRLGEVYIYPYIYMSNKDDGESSPWRGMR